MVQYKLLYFNLMAKGELARLIFTESGVDFTDERFSFEEWPKIKPTTPFEQVPVLFIDGRPLPQSGAIVRHLAREFDLYGDNNMEATYCDMIYETCRDMLDKLPGIALKKVPNPVEAEKEWFEKTIFPQLTKLEFKFKQVDKDFLVGSRITYADLAMVDCALQLLKRDQNVFKNFPLLQAHLKRVSERPRIKEYLANKPDVMF